MGVVLLLLQKNDSVVLEGDPAQEMATHARNPKLTPSN